MAGAHYLVGLSLAGLVGALMFLGVLVIDWWLERGPAYAPQPDAYQAPDAPYMWVSTLEWSGARVRIAGTDGAVADVVNAGMVHLPGSGRHVEITATVTGCVGDVADAFDAVQARQLSSGGWVLTFPYWARVALVS